jgi:hypothetical protein
MTTNLPRLGGLLVTVLGLASVAACTGTSSSTPTATPTGDGGTEAVNPADPTPDEIVAGGNCPAVSGEGTEHSGIISADEVWTAAGSPHRVTFTLYIRAKVTIEPCARVIVSPSGGITVGSNTDVGSLVAKGTSTVSGGGRDVRPIVFDAEDAAAGWPKLEIDAKGTADLSLVALVNGGAGTNNQIGALVVLGVAGGTSDGPLTRSVAVDRVVVEKSRSYGVNLDGWGTFTEGSDKLWVRKGGGEKYPSAVLIEPGIAATLPKNLVATDNLANEIRVSTSKAFMRDDTFRAFGVPYHVMGLLYVNPSTDGAPVTLTVDPGVTVGFEYAAGSGIRMGSSDKRQGILQAVGTPSAPIVFTSAKATKAPGDWMSLYFKATPSTGNRIDHAVVEYAGGDSGTNSFGCGPKSNDGAVFIGGTGADATGPGSAFITNTRFENIAGSTVIVSGWTDDAGPNFAPTNTFGGGTPACKVSRPRRSGAGDTCDGGRDVCW